MTTPETPPVLPTFADPMYPPSVPKTPWWSTWEDVLDVFYAPRDVFERRRDGRYLGSFLIVCIVSIIIAFLSAQIIEAVMDIEFAKQVKIAAAAGRQMSDSDIANMKKVGAFFQKFGIYITPLAIALKTWIFGLIVLGFAKLLGGKLRFSQACVISLLSSVPQLLGGIATGVQGLLLDTTKIVSQYSFSINAARFLPADANKWLVKVAALADPFVLWSLVLVGVGMYVIGKMEKEKAAVAAVLYAVCYTLFAL